MKQQTSDGFGKIYECEKGTCEQLDGGGSSAGVHRTGVLRTVNLCRAEDYIPRSGGSFSMQRIVCACGWRCGYARA